MSEKPEENPYRIGERIAELAAKHEVRRGQLDQLAKISASSPKDATIYWIRKQVQRGYMSAELGSALETILDQVTGPTMQRIASVAADYLGYKEMEPVIKTIMDNKEAIDKTVQSYADKNKLGSSSTSTWVNKGELTLEVMFERQCDRARASQDLYRELGSAVPQLRSTRYRIWLKEVRR
jgi:hypothetical protein